MEHVKDVLWLLETGATVRTIMRELNVSPKTVKKIREAAGRADVHWKDLYDMTEVEVQERLFPPKEKLPDPVLERVVLKRPGRRPGKHTVKRWMNRSVIPCSAARSVPRSGYWKLTWYRKSRLGRRTTSCLVRVLAA